MRVSILGLIFANVVHAKHLPIVQPGLFVISGVATCGDGNGYCLMGNDCTVNEDFLADPNGHCSGLRTAFIPETHFSCCRYATSNSTFDELSAILPPTSTLMDEQMNQTVTSTAEYADADANATADSSLEANGEDTRIENEIDENRMGRTDPKDSGHDARSEPVNLNSLQNARLEYHGSENSDDNISSLDLSSSSAKTNQTDEYSSCLGDTNCRGISSTTAPPIRDVPTEGTTSFEGINFPETGLIHAGGRDQVEEYDSIDKVRRDEASTGFTEKRFQSDDTNGDQAEQASNGEEEFLEEVVANDVQTSRTSRTKDTSAASQLSTEQKVAINHLGCSSDTRLDADVPSASLEDADNAVRSINREVEIHNDIDDHTHLQSPIQWFHVARSLSGDSSPNLDDSANQRRQSLLSNGNREVEEFFGRLVVPEELKGYSFVPAEPFAKDRCLNFSNVDNDVPRCLNVWKFISKNVILCFASLINSVWLLTSASCVTKIYDNGMDGVVVTDVEEKNGIYGISNMIVNENYKSGEQHDINDIGLVSLDRISNSSCFVCLSNEEKKYADKTCSTYVLTADRNNRDSLNKCQGRVKVVNMHSKLYLSLPCTADEVLTQKADNSSANALWCENILVGMETTYYDGGQFVFTSVYEYADWIQQNIQLYL